MSIYYPDLQQHSEEWFALRGRPTASRFSDLVTPAGKPSASATAYIAELAAAYYGNKKPFFETDAMRNGTEREPAARELYELMTGETVDECGFIIERDEPFAPGCSPDGLIGADGGIEIKSPEPWTHMQTIIEGKTPAKHSAQIQGFLFVSGRKWCDFISYCPLFPAEHQLFIERHTRNEQFIAALDAATSSAQAILRKITGV
jgi:hypothetical protein